MVRTTKTQKEVCDLSIAKFFYACNIPFNVASNQTFKDMIEALRPGYSPPDRRQLGGDLLDNVHAQIEMSIKKSIKDQDVTLMQDGWSDIHNSPVIATAVHTGSKAHFISSVESGTNRKDAAYCTKVASDAIADIKATYKANVVGFVSDNENKMKAVRKELEGLHKELITYGCSSHYLNLLGQDLTVPAVMKHVIEIQKFFRNHHRPCALLAEQTGSVKPQLPCATRWNSQVECLESYIRNRPFMLTICNGDQSIESKITNLVNNQGLFNQSKEMLTILRPVTNALDRTQADDCNIAEACHLWLELKTLFEQSGDITSSMKKTCLSRFNAAVTPTHLLSYLLDPRYLGASLSLEMEEAAEQLLRKINPELVPALYALQARGSNIPQHLFDEQVVTTLPRSVWWKTMERKSSTLQPLAKLAQKLDNLPASSAAIERIFSGFSLIQTKLRNRLSIHKMSKLTTCYRNLRNIDLENEQLMQELELE